MRTRKDGERCQDNPKMNDVIVGGYTCTQCHYYQNHDYFNDDVDSVNCKYVPKEDSIQDAPRTGDNGLELEDGKEYSLTWLGSDPRDYIEATWFKDRDCFENADSRRFFKYCKNIRLLENQKDKVKDADEDITKDTYSNTLDKQSIYLAAWDKYLKEWQPSTLEEYKQSFIGGE